MLVLVSVLAIVLVTRNSSVGVHASAGTTAACVVLARDREGEAEVHQLGEGVLLEC